MPRLYWAVYAAGQLAVALRLRVDYNDAFDYLRNARRLAGADVGFGLYHGPLTAALHAPLQLAMDWAGAGDAARLVLPHLFQAVLSAALLFLFYRYLRLSFSSRTAQLATILFSLNRVVVHYFCPVMSEAPCALFVVAALLLLQREGTRAKSAAALALACAILCRWNLLLLPAGLFAYDLAFRRKALRERVPVSAGAIALWFLGCLLLYGRATGSDYWTTARGVVEVMRIGSAEVSAGARAPEPRWKDPLWLFISAGPIVIFLALAGLRRARKDAACRFHAAQFLFLLLAASLAVGHREPRYLLPALPFFYFLAAAGLEELRKRVPLFPIGALVALCAYGAVVELNRYRDPVYADARVVDVARAARKPGAHVYWEGEAVSLAPQEHQFSYEDWGYYVYDVPSIASTAYLLKERLIPVGADGAPPPRDGDVLIRAPARILREGAPAGLPVSVFEHSGASLTLREVIGNVRP